jgi:hypothetical protein
MFDSIVAAIVAFVAAGIDGLVLAFDIAAPADRMPLKHIVRVSQRQNGSFYAYRNVHMARVVNGKVAGDYGADRVATSPDSPTLAGLKPWLEAQGELLALTVGDGAKLRTTYGRKASAVVTADTVKAQIDALKAAHAKAEASKPASKPAKA